MEDRFNTLSELLVKLEYIGVRLENVSPAPDFETPMYVHFSIPESSELELENNTELNEIIRDMDKLNQFAKDKIIEYELYLYKLDYDDDDTHIIEDNISDYIKFYSRVREGEVWNKAKAEERMKEIENIMFKLKGLSSKYKEI